MPGNPTFEPIRGAGRGRHASGPRMADACLPRDLRQLSIRPKDLRHFPAGCRRGHFRWVGGGSEVGENRPRAKTVDFPFTSIPHSPRKGRKRSQTFGLEHIAHGQRWVTSRTSRGVGGGDPADFMEAARHCMRPGCGVGLREDGVPSSPTAAKITQTARVAWPTGCAWHNESSGPARGGTLRGGSRVGTSSPVPRSGSVGPRAPGSPLRNRPGSGPRTGRCSGRRSPSPR